MERTVIFNKLTDIYREVFEDERLIISDNFF